MPNTIIKFVVENKSLLTTVIAIAGFVLSLFQFIHSLWSKRTNISVSLETLCTLNVENKKSIKLGLIFQNNSSSPIIITKVSLLLNHRASYSCVLTHRYHWQLPRGNIISSHLFRFIRHIIGYNANISSWYSIC